MKFFIDTADLNELKDLATTGLIDGITTNPSLVAKANRPFFDILREICGLFSGPISAEVTATDWQTMVKEGEKLAKLAPNIVVKAPLTFDGLKACKILSDNNIQVNVTLCFSSAQALLAAKAGATYISPFVGRLDDIGTDGMGLIAEILEIYRQYPHLTTEVLVASVRHPRHVVDAARMGADVVTIPPAIFRSLYNHPLTDKGLQTFLKDWEKLGQSIL